MNHEGAKSRKESRGRMDDQTSTCEICGAPSDLALTEIVTSRRAVVTHHYCKAHFPQDDDVAYKMEIDSTSSQNWARLRELLAEVERMLVERDDRGIK